MIYMIGRRSTGAQQGILLDAASEKAAHVFKIGQGGTGTIDKVGFLTRGVTTGATVDVRLETVSLTDGFPTGTLLGTNSNGAQVIGDGDDDTWFTTALTTGVAVNQGDDVAVVIVNPSSSPGNMNINATLFDDSRTTPYCAHFTSSWAMRNTNSNACAALEYDDGSYVNHPGVFPISAVPDAFTFNSGSNPDERGIIFQLPFPFRVTGVRLHATIGADCDIVLYDSDGSSVLQTLTIDPDLGNGTGGIKSYPFDSSQDLLADTDYRMVFKPGASNISIQEFTVDTAAIMDSYPGGQKFHHTQRVDGGSWTETTTKRSYSLGIMFDGFDDAAGGSASGVRNPFIGPIG